MGWRTRCLDAFDEAMRELEAARKEIVSTDDVGEAMKHLLNAQTSVTDILAELADLVPPGQRRLNG